MPPPAPYIHLLARAVIRVGDWVLVARCKGASNTFLPGGHVAVGERMHDTIRREVDEEFGRLCVVGEYLGAVEHIFTENENTQHEVNHFFRVQLLGIERPQPMESLEDHLQFFWQPVDQLKAVNLQPGPAMELIRGGGMRWASTLPR